MEQPVASLYLVDSLKAADAALLNQVLPYSNTEHKIIAEVEVDES